MLDKGDLFLDDYKKGVNVNIISPNRILVDNKIYQQIVYGQ